MGAKRVEITAFTPERKEQFKKDAEYIASMWDSSPDFCTVTETQAKEIEEVVESLVLCTASLAAFMAKWATLTMLRQVEQEKKQ